MSINYRLKSAVETVIRSGKQADMELLFEVFDPDFSDRNRVMQRLAATQSATVVVAETVSVMLTHLPETQRQAWFDILSSVFVEDPRGITKFTNSFALGVLSGLFKGLHHLGEHYVSNSMHPEVNQRMASAILCDKGVFKMRTVKPDKDELRLLEDAIGTYTGINMSAADAMIKHIGEIRWNSETVTELNEIAVAALAKLAYVRFASYGTLVRLQMLATYSKQSSTATV